MKLHLALRVAATLLLTALAAPACDSGSGGGGAGGACYVPVGTYTVEASYASGNCDSSLRAGFLSMYPQDHEGTGKPCGTNTSTSTEPLPGYPCSVTTTATAEGTSVGISPGTASVTISCDDGSSCSDTYNLYFTRR